jgi:hypothetical protein
MRGLVLAVAVAVTGCAAVPNDNAVVERAKTVWTACGSRNASVLVRTRLAIEKAAYASVDACADERNYYHDALRATLGPGHDEQIRDAAQRLRSENVRELIRWLTNERDRRKREDLVTGRDHPPQPNRTTADAAP